MALAVFSNRARAHKDTPFDLHPNCLLTRWPLLFATGPRSFFYFDSYWNGYTSYLAEHGYEVFKLRLPWNKPALRRERFIQFFEEQEKNSRHFHLFVDSPTFAEMEDLLRSRNFSCIKSLTEVCDSEQSHNSTSLKALPFPFASVECIPSNRNTLLNRFTYALHKLSLTRYKLPSLSTLGATDETTLANARLLLDRSQVLAETDLRDE